MYLRTLLLILTHSALSASHPALAYTSEVEDLWSGWIRTAKDDLARHQNRLKELSQVGKLTNVCEFVFHRVGFRNSEWFLKESEALKAEHQKIWEKTPEWFRNLVEHTRCMNEIPNVVVQSAKKNPYFFAPLLQPLTQGSVSFSPVRSLSFSEYLTALRSLKAHQSLAKHHPLELLFLGIEKSEWERVDRFFQSLIQDALAPNKDVDIKIAELLEPNGTHSSIVRLEIAPQGSKTSVTAWLHETDGCITLSSSATARPVTPLAMIDYSTQELLKLKEVGSFPVLNETRWALLLSETGAECEEFGADSPWLKKLRSSESVYHSPPWPHFPSNQLSQGTPTVSRTGQKLSKQWRDDTVCFEVLSGAHVAPQLECHHSDKSITWTPLPESFPNQHLYTYKDWEGSLWVTARDEITSQEISYSPSGTRVEHGTWTRTPPILLHRNSETLLIGVLADHSLGVRSPWGSWQSIGGSFSAVPPEGELLEDGAIRITAFDRKTGKKITQTFTHSWRNSYEN